MPARNSKHINVPQCMKTREVDKPGNKEMDQFPYLSLVEASKILEAKLHWLKLNHFNTFLKILPFLLNPR